MFDREEAVRICCSLQEKGGSEDVLRWLREVGTTPIDSIRTLTEFGPSLAQAK